MNYHYKNKLRHLFYWLFVAKKSGFKKLSKDEENRLFKTERLGWSIFGYTPKHKIHVLQSLSVKDQNPFNTCTFNASIGAKEIDEGIVLSVRCLVAWAVKNGFVSGDGFANLEASQKGLKNYGAIDGNFLAELGDWNVYKNVDLPKFAADAEKHKTQTYWSVSSRGDIIKLLDEGRPIEMGMEWFTGFNQGGGFGYPWIVNKKVGYSVGGHGLYFKGYILKYKGLNSDKKILVGDDGQDVYVVQNSYGDKWGATLIDDKGIEHRGCFFLNMDYFHANSWGAMVNLDVPLDTAKFLNEYDGRNVKGLSSTIYHVQAGKKKPYLNWLTYLAFNGKTRGFTLINNELLHKVPLGDSMDIKKSIYWDFLKDVKPDNQLNILYELLFKET